MNKILLALAATISTASAGGYTYWTFSDSTSCASDTVRTLGYIPAETSDEFCKTGPCGEHGFTWSTQWSCSPESAPDLLKTLNPSYDITDYAVMEVYDDSSCSGSPSSYSYLLMNSCAFYMGQYVKVTSGNRFLVCTDEYCGSCVEESTYNWVQNIHKCIWDSDRNAGYKYTRPKIPIPTVQFPTLNPTTTTHSDSPSSPTFNAGESSPTTQPDIPIYAPMQTRLSTPYYTYRGSGQLQASASDNDRQVSLMLSGAAVLVGTLLI